jgi:hypothetical protein
MTNNLGWEFPVDPADQWRGFNDPGIEHFRGDPFGNLAREILQNSLDAATGSPVIVKFAKQDVLLNDVPNIDELRSSFTKCLTASQDESPKAKEFFEQAAKILSSKRTSVLSIEEENTSGIIGPCRNGKPYFAFMKATGQSKKDADAAETGLGSYGIGKFAPFAVSDLRTIFVSTIFPDGQQPRQYTQGKAILMSHKDGSQTHQNVGYWGVLDNCMPVEGCLSNGIDWLLRAGKQSDLPKRIGTTFHILGFHAVKDWEKFLIASVLEHFFGAIWKSKLVVHVDDEVISKATIRGIFGRKTLREALIGVKGEPDRFDNARSFLKTLEDSKEVFIEDQQNIEIGNCQVRIIVAENLPKRVAVLRNGMFITDQMDTLKRFGDFKEFAAVVECHSKKGNQLLRDMEPPKHDDFQPALLITPEQQEKGQRALTLLGRWVREMLKRHARDPIADVSEVKELAHYFPDDSGDSGGDKGEEINPVGKIEIRAQPHRRRPVVIKADVEGDEGGLLR